VNPPHIIATGLVSPAKTTSRAELQTLLADQHGTCRIEPASAVDAGRRIEIFDCDIRCGMGAKPHRGVVTGRA
jgi:hypothetical protein